jgi:tetratricopeptide (TPR) repeat protein
MLCPTTRPEHDRHRPLLSFLAVTTLATVAGLARPGIPSASAPAAMPPPKAQAYKLSPEDSQKVAALGHSIDVLWRSGKFRDAADQAREIVGLCEPSLGRDHWRSADARRRVETLEKVVGLPDEGRQALSALPAMQEQMDQAYARADYAEAEKLGRQIAATNRTWLGESHPETAESENNLGQVCADLKRLEEAATLTAHALEVWRKSLGEGHPETATGEANLGAVLRELSRLEEAEAHDRLALALRLKIPDEAETSIATSRNNLGVVLYDLGRLAEAEDQHTIALTLRRKALGENHPVTASSESNLGATLCELGRLEEAEAHHRRALAAWLESLTENHPDTAIGYNNLATVLRSQGRLEEANEMYRHALKIWLNVLSEDHPNIASGYSNLGNVLNAQGRAIEAEREFRFALAIRLKSVGEGHPDTASSRNNLAQCLFEQRRYDEAEQELRMSLAIREKALPAGHPDTGHSFSNLGVVLSALRKPAEAEAMNRKALEIFLSTRNEGHPDIATTYGNLAVSLDRLGRPEEALDALTKAADAYDQTRFHGVWGLDAALKFGGDPSSSLAVASVRAGHWREAWARWERGLARAVLDEATGRPARPLTPSERAINTELARRSQTLEERINRLAGRTSLGADDQKRLESLRRDASEVRRRLLEFEQDLERKYGTLAGKPASLDEVRASLPEDTALVGWADSRLGHAACIVRRTGEPAWVLIPGSGRDGDWTRDDETAARRFRAALADRAAEGELRPMAEALASQRLGPLGPHLKGIRRVVVVNSPGLAGVPAELLFEARAGWGGPTLMVSYAPSASMFVHLTRAKIAGRPATLLALGDPAYPEPKLPRAAPAPPDRGLLVTNVIPNRNADLCGVKPGDILLDYNKAAIRKREDLKIVAVEGNPKRVPVLLWRAGDERAIEVSAGPLGVVLDPRPAALVVMARRDASEVRNLVRGEDLKRLEGTRREVNAIAQLLPPERVKTLLGDEARESVVQALAREGKLKDYRYLLFAAHGRDDPRSAYRTALLLAPDPERSAEPAAFDTDGELTAKQISQTWDLDAELVTISTCNSALGLQAGGEGFLGFAQPLFARGARTLVLSLWKADDQATSLLMARFYQNLFGRREGMNGPMPKVEALDEAKRWLRSLTAEDIGPALDNLDRGDKRPLAPADKPRPVARPLDPRKIGPRRYDHPYYWAAFVLIGDPA